MIYNIEDMYRKLMGLTEELIHFIKKIDSYTCGCCGSFEEELQEILKKHNYENKNKR